MWTITRSERALAIAFLGIGLALVPRSSQAQEAPPSPAAPAPDPLGPLRERFKEGMDRYRAGAFGDAAVIWESIYRELGPDTGYRLAFNLGRAYDQLGDSIKAAEHYETYLARVRGKHDAGETLEANVEKQEAEAKERLAQISAVKGRIRVRQGTRPVVTRIDNAPPRVSGFVVYVEPGNHTVRFEGDNGAEETRELSVRPGEIAELDPPAPKRERPIEPPPPPKVETRTERPFSPTVLWVSGGLTLASFAIPIIAYSSALSIKSDYDAAGGTRADKERIASDYDSARSNAYATTAVPIVFAATTLGLAIWYLVDGREVTTSSSVARIGSRRPLRE